MKNTNANPGKNQWNLLIISFNFIFLLFSFSCFAQGVAINNDGSSPHASAILDAKSSDKGFLPPRMTTTERNLINSPAIGLQIFNTSTNCLEFFVGSSWQNISCGCLSAPASPAAGSHVISSSDINWKWNAVSGATGYKFNTVNNYSTATDNGSNTNYVQTGLACVTGYTLYVWSYNTCGNSSSTMLSQTTSACSSASTCGLPLTINHIAGVVAPATLTVTYGTVESKLTGASKCWITRNLGASIQAASSTDASAAAAGWFWQFNRKQGYVIGPTPAWTITSINDDSNWSAVNDPCTIELGAGWRIPTNTEWITLSDGWNDYNSSFNSVLKIHAAGRLVGTTGVLTESGTHGRYWSSIQQDNSSAKAVQYRVDGVFVPTGMGKTSGLTVRCIKD